MKNYIKLLPIFLLLLASCTSEEYGPEITGVNMNPIFLQVENGINLDPDYPNNPALTLNWDYADYGVNVVPNYAILFSSDEAFTNESVAGVTTSRTFSWSSQALNSMVQTNLGLPVNEPNNLFVKVVSYLGPYYNHAFEAESNVLSFVIEPYASYNFKDWYLVGSATAAGWNNNNNNPPIFRNAENPNLYTYTGYFNGGGDNAFKLIEVPGQWAPMYGTDDGGSALVARPTEADPDPPSWVVAASGYYTYTFDFDTLIASKVEYDESSATDYNSMGLIGSATAGGWDSDTPMTQSSFDPHLWYLSNVELNTGEAKFRANGNWDVSWGSDTIYSGTATSNNGPNVPVAGGTYNVWFTDLTGDYMFIPVN